jgi:membrane protease YdiL (CAAX protease family)
MNIPAWAAVPIVAAFLVEFSLYLVAGAEPARAWLEQWPRPRLAAAMTASGASSYLVYSLGLGLFRWQALLLLTLVAAAISFWYIALRPGAPADFGFLALVAVIVLGNLFDPLFPSPVAQIKGLDILGQLTLIRLITLAALSLRHMKGVGFGFLPRWREWLIGLREYACFAVIGFPLAVWLGALRWHPAAWHPGRAILTFVAFLWVVALFEELVFRGLLQQWLRDWTGSAAAALVLTSVIFGLVHLPFREFPNWRFALVAAIAGWFYGRAYQRAGSIRAAMVAHAFVVTTWRSAFA